MSIYIGDTKVSGNGRISCFPLFTPQWQDHIINDASWLRANTFSWQSGNVYVAAYQHLLNDYNNLPKQELPFMTFSGSNDGYSRSPEFDVSGATHPYAFTAYYTSTLNTIYADSTNIDLYKTCYTTADGSTVFGESDGSGTGEPRIKPTVEVINGIKIAYYTANDGHKLILPNQEANASTIFNATGVAWYYLLDTTNTRFKLPISRWNFVGLRNGVGNYVDESLPNITGKIDGSSLICNNSASGEGAIILGYVGGASIGGSGVPFFHGSLAIDASGSSSTYQSGAPVQQRATQMYLYFYVGNTVVNETLVDVGEITDELQGKVDLAAGVLQADVDYVVESYQSGTSGYRIYKNGWCEQWGTLPAGGWASAQINLLKTMADTNYIIVWGNSWENSPTQNITTITSKTTTSFYLANYLSWSNWPAYWKVEGYIA